MEDKSMAMQQREDLNEWELDQLQDRFEEFLDGQGTGSGCDRKWCERCEFEPVCQGQEIIV
jgi:hypothetical protein